ncbi:MAG: hypothetical protein ACXVA9_09665 [Bdellovibrionales bacterium]
MKPTSTFFLSLFTALAATACSTPPPKAESLPPSAEAKIVAQKEKASYVSQISFDKGSAKLTTSAMDKIDEMIQRARRDGAIDDVKVIAWADQEYPSSAKKTLNKRQLELAAKRAEAISSYIKQQSAASIHKYNMAERPNPIQELVASPDARIKRSLEDAGIATTAHNLRYPENASKAMVMLILKE